jgi:hypothetical protein
MFIDLSNFYWLEMDDKCTTQQSQDIIQQILHMKRVEHFSKYLGMPTKMGRAKSQVFDYIQDRILKKLKGWKEKHLFLQAEAPS